MLKRLGPLEQLVVGLVGEPPSAPQPGTQCVIIIFPEGRFQQLFSLARRSQLLSPEQRWEHIQ
jgi:hypothetical protein